MNDKEILVYYHRIDLDGKCSGYIVKQWADRNGYTCTFVGINYDEPFDLTEVEDKVVVICDFTFKPHQMMMILNLAKEVVWIDHHASSLTAMGNHLFEELKLDINPFKGLQISSTSDTGFAGCELTWLYFFGLEKLGLRKQSVTHELCNLLLEGLEPRDSSYLLEVPDTVLLLGRYDVWDLKFFNWDDALALQYGMKQLPFNPTDSEWDSFFTPSCLGWDEGDVTELNKYIKQGYMLQAYTDANSTWYINEYGYEARFKNPKFEHLTVYALCTGFKGSQSFVHHKNNYDVLCAYVHLADGRFGISFYSATGTNVAEIAVSLGGGGHTGAAGTKVRELPFEEIN